MPPSINTNLFNSSVKPNKYIEKIKKNINKIVVTYAGNFSYYQGTDLLIEIIKKLKDRNIDDFIFVIIGTTNEAFNKKIEEYHLKSEVIFMNKTAHGDEWKLNKVNRLVLMLKGAMAANGKVGLMMNQFSI